MRRAAGLTLAIGLAKAPAAERRRRTRPRTMWRSAAGLACALVLAACADGPAPTPVRPGTPTAVLTLEPPAGSPWATATAIQPAPSPRPGDSSPPATVACSGTDVAFPSAVLGPFSEVLPLTPPGRALAAFIATEAGAQDGLPRDGWRRASAGPSRVTFVAPVAGAWAFATMAQLPDGSWAFDEGGACELAPRAPASLGFASWALDPSATPAAGAMRLTIAAVEEACANGRPPGDRALTPVVDETDTTVTITILVRRLGNADCPANPSFPVEVWLARPLGGRALLDGSRYPPARRG